MNERCERWIVSGRVQGVGFRWFVLRAARLHGVRGDVRNLPDGRVEVRACGEAPALEDLWRDVNAGPRGARVEGARREALAPLDVDGFEIR
jgi:acylphosphatase